MGLGVLLSRMIRFFQRTIRKFFMGIPVDQTKIVQDFSWSEVHLINRYALFMGYLSMAVRGLGFLVLTWTTVVLLGGFVSTLEKRDFWCLTFITLVQIAGIFDVFLNEKLSYIGRSALALMSGIFAFVEVKNESGSHSRADEVWVLFRFFLLGVQLLLLVILLCPLVAVYMFGILISTGISLWRLIQHNYVGSNAGGSPGANLKPALDVLYSLALLQGVVFCYRFTFGRAWKNIVHVVAHRLFPFELPRRYPDEALGFVSDYLDETRIGCEKDPSFGRGRNLITYAVDLMRSNSPDDYNSGVRILGTLRMSVGQKMLMKHLMIMPGASSSNHILQKLLQALDLKTHYDDLVQVIYKGESYGVMTAMKRRAMETRRAAASLVETLAENIHLEQFPRGVQYISCLIDTFEGYCLIEARFNEAFFVIPLDSDNRIASNDYKKLLLQGLCILWKLAADENNCRIMSNAKGLLLKIMAPVNSDLLHHIDHSAWNEVVMVSLQVIRQLAAAPGETGTKLRRDISSSKEAIRTMERILSCTECNSLITHNGYGYDLHGQVIGILTRLHMDMGTRSRENFIMRLVEYILSGDGNLLRELATEALAMLLSSQQGGSNAKITLQVNGEVVASLTRMLFESSSYRIRVAEILENLCIYYTQDDECLKKLKETMTMPGVIPKVLSEILPGQATQTGRETDKPSFSTPHDDIEDQHGVVSQDNGRNNVSSSHHQDVLQVRSQVKKKDVLAGEKGKLQAAALLSLCVTVCDTFISDDQDLNLFFRKWQDLAVELDVSSFPSNLKEMVVKSSDPTLGCLRMMKAASKMVISMMKHRGNYPRQDLESLMEAMSSALKNMFLLDGSVVFASADDGATAKDPGRSLTALVREAQELVGNYMAKESQGIAPSTSVSGKP